MSRLTLGQRNPSPTTPSSATTTAAAPAPQPSLLCWLRSAAPVDLSGPNEAGLVRGDDGLHAVAQVKFGQDMPEVGLHRGLAEEQLGGDLGVGEATADQSEDVDLALGQRGERWREAPGWRPGDEALHQPTGQRRVDECFASGNRPDG